MFAEIITIGDEILIGQIVDSNSAFIAKELNRIGISVYQVTSVQDDIRHIKKALSEAEANADIIIMTGGLGPTKDDITKNTLASYFDDVLVQNDLVLKNIEDLWRKYVKQDLAQVNIDQALVPSRAKVLMNHHGSAPGMWLEKENKVFIALPGVPFEMKALVKHQMIPALQSQLKLPFILHKTLLTYGVGESKLAERLELWANNLPKFIKLAYLPSLGRVRLRLSAKGDDKSVIIKEMDRQLAQLIPLVDDVFVGFEEEHSIEAIIGKRLMKLSKTLATAESCTGGKIAEKITAIPGASNYFKGSIVSYATQSKIDVLKVDALLIKKYSVVSTQVAEEMAKQARIMFDSDFAIATTGNAGPTKGDLSAEIGTVCIAIATSKDVMSHKFNFGNHRIKVINKAVNKAFELLQKEIFKK